MADSWMHLVLRIPSIIEFARPGRPSSPIFDDLDLGSTRKPGPKAKLPVPVEGGLVRSPRELPCFEKPPDHQAAQDLKDLVMKLTTRALFPETKDFHYAEPPPTPIASRLCARFMCYTARGPLQRVLDYNTFTWPSVYKHDTVVGMRTFLLIVNA
ncbi:hypothetical protein WN51_10396 [Melipona quadrifasciata]|uniref:Uncharacterized protein n=1 Tax=Melipona quadrifasciata TaxID=166423 RepID=A0A0N1ITU7_9HYME|nr:hypothetical protein WN51_10396 [Melipona quadrifasciata]